MDIIFLGTSSGTPTKTRNVSGIVIKKSNSKFWCLVDCGEGTQHQLLHTKLALGKLQIVLITHVHGDHCYGLPGLLASASLTGRKEALTIVGPPEIGGFIEVIKKTSQLHLSYMINFIAINDISKAQGYSEFDIEAIELSHRVPSFAFVFSERDIQQKLDINKLHRDNIEPGANWGKLQKGQDVTLSDGRTIQAEHYLHAPRASRKVVICGDNDKPELLSEIAASTDVLVHEATYTEDVALKLGKERQHCSAKAIAMFAQKTSIRNLIVTHFSPRYQTKGSSGATISDIENELKENYSGKTFLANDFDTFRLDNEGELAILTIDGH